MPGSARLVLKQKKHTCHSSTNGYKEATPAHSNVKEQENDRIRNRRRTHLLSSTHTHRRNQRSRHRQRQMAHIRTHRNQLDGGRVISPHHITQAVERAQQALTIAQEKPSPKGQGGGSSNVEPPMPLPAGVISAKRELRDMLLDWTALVSEGLAVVAHCDPTEPSMLAWLGSGERADHLAAHEAAQDFLDELAEVTKQLESPYLPRAGKKYIGNYGGGAVYIREGQRTVELADGTEVPV